MRGFADRMPRKKYRLDLLVDRETLRRMSSLWSQVRTGTPPSLTMSLFRPGPCF